MDFYEYTSTFEAVAPKCSWQEFYKQVLLDIIKDGILSKNRDAPSCFNHGEAEKTWYACKKPYYKLYPEVLPWIYEAARLDVPNELLRLPFSSIVIRFPKNHRYDFLSIDEKHFARSILMTEIRDGNVVDLPTAATVAQSNDIIIWIDFGEKLDGIPICSYQHLVFKEGMTVEESLQIAQSDRDPEERGLFIPNDIMRNCLRIAAAVCFLSTGADKIVEADVLNKDMLKYIQAENDKDENKQKKIRQRAKQRGKHGWTIGRNRELLFPAKPQQGGESQGTGQELRFQHQRSGHFHVVRFGTGKSQTKVQWYRQLTVRADLPAPPVDTQRGYKTQ